MNEEFSEPRLAAVYDALNPWGRDNAFYLGLPRRQGEAILDMGCGTGMLACAFAAAGHRVTGADPTPAMLALARARAGGARVDWVEASAQGFRAPRRFDLVVMTGHVFQFFLDDTAVQDALGNLRRHLAGGGRLAFETRNPRARGWSAWTPERSRETVPLAGGGRLEAWSEVDEVGGGFVRFTMFFRLPGEPAPLVSKGTLRFMDRDTLMDHLARAGLRLEALYGDWDASPWQADSPEMIVLAGAG